MIHSVLIVEDDALIASDLDAFLEAAGYAVIGIATDMRVALTLAARFKPDAATMDVDLADGTDGVETARRLSEKHGARSLFISARLTPRMREAAFGRAANRVHREVL
jgi:DNA-binding response OmpR family regulator